VLLRT
jgi:hypothetical protein